MEPLTMPPLLNMAINASLEASGAILEIYGSGDLQVEQKKDNSPLTRADRAAHTIISKHLGRSGIEILSEEGQEIPFSERSQWKKLWIVDPLDGTKEFIKRNGEFTINIALVEAGIPVLGVIYVPVLKTLYFSERNSGAFIIEKSDLPEGNIAGQELLKMAIPLPRPSGKRPFTVVGSRSHMNDATQQFINEIRSQHEEIAIISRGSSLKLCQIAEGKADIYPRFAPTMEWDTAAGQALVEHAGGMVRDAETGNPLRYNRENLRNPWFIASATS